jgi:hypothetical protein
MRKRAAGYIMKRIQQRGAKRQEAQREPELPGMDAAADTSVQARSAAKPTAQPQPKYIIKHRHTANYTILPNEVYDDLSISNGALGLLGKIMRMPTDWVLHESWLVKHSKEGKVAVHREMTELITAGYVYKQSVGTRQSGNGVNKDKQWTSEVYYWADDQPHTPAEWAMIATPPPIRKPDSPPIRKPATTNTTYTNETATNCKAPEPVPEGAADGQASAAAAPLIREKLKALDPVLAGTLSSSFYHDAEVYMREAGLDDGYPEWLYNQVKAKRPDNLAGYYFAVFRVEGKALEYKQWVENGRRQPGESEPRTPIVCCPVCDIAWYDDGRETCTRCGHDMSLDEHGEKTLEEWKEWRRKQDEEARAKQAERAAHDPSYIPTSLRKPNAALIAQIAASLAAHQPEEPPAATAVA